MSPKRLVFLAVSLALIGGALVVTGCGSSDGSSDSSEWSSDDTAKVESALSDKLTEEGVTPSKAMTECIVKGLEPLASASEVLGNADTTPEQQEQVEELTSGCISDPSGALDDLYSGPACQDNLSSGECVEEVQGKLGEVGAEAEEESESSSPEEESGEYEEEEYEEENEGLNELNEELQKE